MKWETVAAEVFCNSVRDGTHDTPKPSEHGYKLITGKHIQNGQIDPTDAYLISEKDYLKINERSQVDKWDVLLSMIGNGLGRSAVVKETPDYAIKNIALFKVGNEIKAKWLHYFFTSSEGQSRIYNSLQGSGQPFISLSNLRSFLIPNPPYEMMKQAVSIISVFDDLIENNQKQIKLLEEAAQRLYKVWFVDLRFPGHETTPIVDGVPEGWEKRPIGEAFETVLGGTPSRANNNYWGGEINWINSGEINNLRIIKPSERITELALKESATKKMPIHTTVLAITGATLGQVSYTEIETCANQSVVGIIDKSHLYSCYLYLYVSDRIWHLIGKATGGAQQHINKDIVNAYPVLLPTAYVTERFNEHINPIFDKMAGLLFQIEKLNEARDRLLPKLMSGEIEV